MTNLVFLDTECSVDGCHEPPSAKGMCNPHYQRQHRKGTPGSVAVRQGRHGNLNPKWRGGKSSHPLYDLYYDMVGRCHRPTHARYANYGGRGITVCERWRADFWAFVADMGERPDGLTLDRRDNDAGYSPNNCRWATHKEQVHNRRTRFSAEARAEMARLHESGLLQREIAQRFGITQTTVSWFIRQNRMNAS